MTQPDPKALFSALDATWAPQSMSRSGPFMLRDGKEGGKRVSAASLEAAHFSPADIDLAEDGMREFQQTPLFQLRQEDEAFDAALAARGYTLIDPVTIYCAPTSRIAAHGVPDETVLNGPVALELMAEIWASGGIPRPRIDVMNRVRAPKTYMLLRHDNRGCGCGFVAAQDDIAMLHALEVAPHVRRKGLARAATAFAAVWAQEQGANWLALATVKENAAACALYEGMGFTPAANYHYRIAAHL